MATPRTGSLVEHLRRTMLRAGHDAWTDAALLHAFLTERDGTAFEILVERHGPMVWGVCRRVLRNQHDAEDAFQATFLVLARKAASVCPRDKLPSWLYGVAFQTAVRVRCARAKHQKRERQVANMPEPVAWDPSPWDDLQPLLDQEIARLHARYRDVVILCDLQGRTRSAVARQLRIPEGTVASRLATARQTLAKRLARYGLPVSGATLASILAQDATAKVPTAAIHGATAVGTAAPARIAALVDDVLKAMLLAKLRGVAMVFLALGLIAFSGQHLASHLTAGGPEPLQAPKPEQPSAPALDTPRVDRYGDPLPAGAIARLGTLRFRHPSWVGGLAYTPDEKMLVSACYDIHLWDPATGMELRVFPADSAACVGVAITPDGKTLIALENSEVLRACDLASGKERWRVQAGNGFALALAPDGKTIAKGLGGDKKQQQISLWNADTGEHLRTLGAIKRSVSAVAFSRDGKLLAAGDGAPLGKADPASSVRLWDPTDGRAVRELKGHTSGVTAVAFSPIGALLASASHDGTVCLWNPADGRLLRKITVPDDPWLQIAVGSDLIGHAGGVVAIAFSPDGRWLACGGYDGSMTLWDVGTGKALHSMRGHGREVTSLIFSRDGKVLTSGSRDHTIRRWDAATGKELQPRDGHSGPVHAIAVSPDGRCVASACEGRSIHLWLLASGRELRSLAGAAESVYSLAFSPDGRVLASAAANGTIHIWDAQTGRELRTLLGHKGAVYTIAFSKVENVLLSGGADGTLRCWDWSQAKQIRQLPSKDFGAFYLTVSRDGKTVGADGAQARFWEVATGKEVCRVGADWAHMAMAADGKSCVIHRRDGMLQAWNLLKGEEAYAFPGPAWSAGHAGTPRILLSPDGRLLAAPSKGGITVWEMATGKVRRRFSGHHGYVVPFTFSPDGRTLLTGGEDTTIVVWDLARRHEPRPDSIAPAELEALWRDLGGADAGRADLAIGTLAARPAQSVPWLAKNLVPATLADPVRLKALLRDLDSDEYAVRDRAATDLRQLGEQALPALQHARAHPPSLEARRRIETLLASLRLPFAASKLLQSLRAVEVLERIDRPAARTLFKTLAAGAPEARLTQEAARALARLDQR